MTEDTVKAKVMAINARSVSVLTLTGPFKDRLYRLDPRSGLQVDQFVDVVIGLSGQTVRWADDG
jgi:hypothetical protein